MTTNLKSIAIFFIALSLLIFSTIYIFTQFNWEHIYKVLLKVNLKSFIIGSSITIILFWAIRACRWWLLLKIVQKNHVPFFPLYLSSAFSLGLSILTPFQSGELVKIEMMKKIMPLSRSNGYLTFAFERILDLLIVSILALSGFIMNVSISENNYFLILLGILIITSITIFLIIWLSKHKPFKFELLSELQKKLILLTKFPFKLIQLFFLTLVAWLVLAAGWWWSLMHIEVLLSPTEIVSLTSSMTLVNVASFIPGAVGISEAGISLSLIYLGVTETLAHSGSIMIRAYGILAILLGLLHIGLYLRYKNNRSLFIE